MTNRYGESYGRPTTDGSDEAILLAKVNELPDKAQAVLAAALVAVLWPEKFPGGWIDQFALSHLTPHVDRPTPATGEPPPPEPTYDGGGARQRRRKENQSESRRQAFYRARDTLRALPGVRFEDRRGHRALLRLTGSPPQALLLWLFEQWPRFIARAVWYEFMCPASNLAVSSASVLQRAAAYRDAGQYDEALSCIATLEAHTLTRDQHTQAYKRLLLASIEGKDPSRFIFMGLINYEHRYDTFTHDAFMRNRLGDYDERYVPPQIALARATVLLARRKMEDLNAAKHELQQALATPLPLRSVSDALMYCRLWLRLAWALFYEYQSLYPEDMAPPQHLVAECAVALEHAEQFGSAVSLSDHAHALVLRALLTGLKISLELDDLERAGVLTDAIKTARLAFSLAEAGETTEVMKEALWAIAALEWTRAAVTPTPTLMWAAEAWEAQLQAMLFGSADMRVAQYKPLLWADTIPDEFMVEPPKGGVTDHELYGVLSEIIGDVWQSLVAADVLQRAAEAPVRDAYRRYVRLVVYLKDFWGPGGVGAQDLGSSA